MQKQVEKLVSRQIQPRLKRIREVYDDSPELYDEWMNIWSEKVAPAALVRAYAEKLGDVCSAGSKLIEVGSGTGRNLSFYGGARQVVLVDLCEQCLRVAEDRWQQAGHSSAQLVLNRTDSSVLPFEDESFDTGISTFHLCVCPDPQESLRELVRVVKPGGVVFLFEYQKSAQNWLQIEQRMLRETMRNHGLFYRGSPAVCWDPVFDIKECLDSMENTSIQIESESFWDESFFVSKALIVIRKLK